MGIVKKTRKMYLVLIMIFILGFRFFTGVYESTEHDDRFFFIKHRPVWKYYFSTTERKIETYDSLDIEEKKEVAAYQEFVKNKKYSFYIY